MGTTLDQLDAELTRLLGSAVESGITPSAVCAVAVDGERLPVITVGDAVRFGAGGVELPAGQRTPADAGTFYDLASVTKTVTAVTALALVDGGVLQLDEPVADLLPGWAPDAGGEAGGNVVTNDGGGDGNAVTKAGGKETVTLRHLLTHTSGLPAVWPGWRVPLAAGLPFDREALLADLLSTELAHAPATRFEYSCTGFNTIMALAEHATGQSWPELVRAHVLARLAGESGLTFFPGAARCAATEHQPEHGRGMVRGTVHDEAAWSLGGAAGNAGLFGTAPALLDFGESLRAGLPGILSPGLAEAMWTDQLPAVLGDSLPGSGAEYGHGLGLRIGQSAWMGSSDARGHNGFTGTSLLVDRGAGISIALLSNRVHPRRESSDVGGLRLAVSRTVYAALS
ncbi:serine hydrolase domain-containing protein [Arthrobacter sp. CG_A4]|uniref:serine hydrolase domain-containing protein n=1 Tax=Arthrobacter sp. CG_A4 TaxID=3071706 RepID=UPI002DF842C5|nr:CubicO group peptidase (beta-lactamase class C family) [Arthrobacter sp. CG_A4]